LPAVIDGGPNVNQVAFVLGGFILFRTGFFGGGTNSVAPPLALIFSSADFEKWWAFTVSFLVRSPVPRTRTLVPSGDVRIDGSASVQVGIERTVQIRISIGHGGSLNLLLQPCF
jgi:hypothetical protein